MTYSRLALLLAMAASPACAQLISLGIQGGIPLNNPMQDRDDLKRYLVGPTLEVRLSPHISAETGFSYRHFGSDSQTSTFQFHRRGDVFEVPLLAKYLFRNSDHKWRPFINAGTGWQLAKTETSYSQLSGTPIYRNWPSREPVDHCSSHLR